MKTKFQCEICLELYETPEEALACEALVEEVNVEIGDIVTTGQDFGWYNGDSLWIASTEASRQARDGNLFNFFYVVTAITQQRRFPHKKAIHLETLAMVAPEGYRGGWTSKDHLKPRKARNVPEEVKEQSKPLIGHVFDTLL